MRTIPLGTQQHEHLVRAMLRRKPGAHFIFPGGRGGQMNRGWFDKQLRLWRIWAGLPGMTFHDLRHTFASWMIAADVNPKTLQVLMGHENWSVTMDTYGHLLPTATESAMQALQRFLSSLAPSDGTSGDISVTSD